jgi:hypothetical protein
MQIYYIKFILPNNKMLKFVKYYIYVNIDYYLNITCKIACSIIPEINKPST